MRGKGGVVSGAALALIAALPAHAVEEAPRAVTEAGTVSGASVAGVDAFRGIAFAAPPVGDLRWRAPQPVRPWQGVRNASAYADDCPQEPLPGIAAPLGAPLSEDCLYLNVWRPQHSAAGAKLPVMVWIHGGGFVNGGASPAVFRGDAFARHGIVMVGIAYRVGRFGFFAHPALSAENKDGGQLGNYGYMDEIAALRWVQRNIAAFGGDPAQVTIFGESAGGSSVQMLLASPETKGLFIRAIVQSGGGRGNLMGERYVTRDNGATSSLETVGLAFARANGIVGTGPDALARLRALPVSAVVDGLNMATVARQQATYGGPAVDGRIVVTAPDVAYGKGMQAHVPLIIGATSADLGHVAVPDKEATFAPFGGRAAAARVAYDPDGKATVTDLAAAIGGDRTMVEPARHVATLFRRRGLPVWEFRFSYVADAIRTRFPAGAPHASDVPFAMATVRDRYGAATTARDEALGDTMNRYWANFAKTGNPNGPGLPAWPRYDPATDLLMDFAADGAARAKPDPRKARLDLVATIAP